MQIESGRDVQEWLADALVLPCVSCAKHAHVTYVRTMFPEENAWVCPSCGRANRLRFKGRVMDATLRAI
jgi:hypothetical protein